MTSRYEDADVWYQLLRAYRLGMFVARSDEEQAVLKKFGQGGTGKAPSAPKPLSELVPLTDAEYRGVRPALVDHFAPLKEAHGLGMLVARNEEEEEIRAELRRLLGPPMAS